MSLGIKSSLHKESLFIHNMYDNKLLYNKKLAQVRSFNELVESVLHVNVNSLIGIGAEKGADAILV